MNSKLIHKIGLVLDQNKISVYEVDFIKSCQSDPNLDINLILIKNTKNFQLKVSGISWKILLLFEKVRLYFSSFSSHFQKNTLEQTKGLENIPSFCFQPHLSHQLKKQNFHYIVSFDYCKNLLAIRNAADADLIFFYKQFSNLSNSLIGFDEIIKKDPRSYFSIISIKKRTNNLKIIFEGSFLSSLYFSANQANIFFRRNYYLLQILRNTPQEACMHGNDFPLSFHELNNIARIPPFSLQLLYLKNITQSFLSILLARFLERKVTWSVFYTREKWNNINSINDSAISNPENGYLADPFIIDEFGRSFVFVERVDFIDNKGKISVYEIGDFKPKDLGVIIEENFHLSYPFVFRDGENLYLVPESSKNNDIRLYECESFPTKWRLRSIILDNVSAADTLIFKHERKWWLFTNLNPSNTADHCSELFIFSSNNLTDGDWVPHSKNPIYIDPVMARNGGIIFDGEDIYRVSQEQGYGIYGNNININKIIGLDDKNYVEKRVAFKTKNFLNIHHLHTSSSYTVYDKWFIK